MFIQPHQFRNIAVPKRTCQRSLESYVVAAHQGDKQVYNTRKSNYLYMNNPIYRTSIEGDPAPGGLSSRQFQAVLKPTESQLHSLHPTIDSGNVFLTERLWDGTWRYQRDNIPNSTADPHEFSAFDVREDAINNNAHLEDYDWFVNKTLIDWDEREKHTRYLPIYDQAGISDKLVPDGVHESHRYKPPKFKPRIQEQIPPKELLTENYDKTSNDKESKIENYVNTRDRDSIRSKIRPNYYGYPKSTNYATMGSTDGIYYVSPQNSPDESTDGVAGVYANRVDRSGTSTYGNLSNAQKPSVFSQCFDNDFRLGNPDLIRYPVVRGRTSGIENFEMVKPCKPQTYRLWLIFAVVILIILIVCLAYYMTSKKKKGRK